MNQQTLTKRNATTWVHAWATGWQQLVFENDAAAQRWASANNVKYRA